MPSHVSFRLAKPVVVAPSKDTSTTTTIPSGSVVQVVNPAVGDGIEVQWGRNVYSVSLSSLLQACRDDERGRWAFE